MAGNNNVYLYCTYSCSANVAERYLEIVPVATAVSLDVQVGEVQRDLISGRSFNSHGTISVLRVVGWPARTDDTTARRRQHLVARYTSQHFCHFYYKKSQKLYIFCTDGTSKIMSSAYRNIAAQLAPILHVMSAFLTSLTKSSIKTFNKIGDSTPLCRTPVFNT